MINQFTWKRSSAHSDAKQGAKHAGRISDLIFWYAKGNTWTHNVQFTPYDESYIEDAYRFIEAGTGRIIMQKNITEPSGYIQFDTQNLANGLYVLCVKQNNKPNIYFKVVNIR